MMTTGKTNETGMTDADPGMEENRLSLNPNEPAWKDTLAAWKDGEEYPITDLPEGTTIRQISPGEFTVVPPAEAPEVEEEAEEAPSSKSKVAESMMEEKA